MFKKHLLNKRKITMYKILIATHANMAMGIKNSIEFITKSEIQVDYFNCFTDIVDPEKEIDKYFSSCSSEDKVVVLTDLMAGSVNQLFMKQLEKSNFKLVTGINLPLALEIILSNAYEDDDINNIIENAKNEIKYVNLEIEKFKNNQVDDDLF